LIASDNQLPTGSVPDPSPSELWGHTSIAETHTDESNNCDSYIIEEDDDLVYSRDEKVDRLIDWNVEVLVGLLEKVVSRRFEVHGRTLSNRSTPIPGESCNILDEVNEIVALPPFDPKAAMRSGECTLKLPNEVKFQLRVFVTTIASLYLRGNAFHNFDHASHVLMSANKLMKRIVSHDDIDSNNIMDREAKSKCVEEHHKSTFGISSDPLAQFAIVFSALIHDVEHTGVPNTRRMHEEPEMALKYRSKSVAEQNSVAVAWDILMQEQFVDLQRSIFSNDDDRHRFRQLVVNSVMATDIMDRDLQELRTKRWAKAFQAVESTPATTPSTTEEDINRKATIVIEHIIQASDVAHTMQHWHIFTRWNERLFNEMYTAYLQGRSDKDPSEDWYDGKKVGLSSFAIVCCQSHHSVLVQLLQVKLHFLIYMSFLWRKNLRNVACLESPVTSTCNMQLRIDGSGK
jgi:3'5'-cyclic nucleotide phosphodiesterase